MGMQETLASTLMGSTGFVSTVCTEKSSPQMAFIFTCRMLTTQSKFPSLKGEDKQQLSIGF